MRCLVAMHKRELRQTGAAPPCFPCQTRQGVGHGLAIGHRRLVQAAPFPRPYRRPPTYLRICHVKLVCAEGRHIGLDAACPQCHNVQGGEEGGVLEPGRVQVRGRGERRDQGRRRQEQHALRV